MKTSPLYTSLQVFIDLRPRRIYSSFFQHLSGPGVRAWQALAPDGRAGAEGEEEEAGDGLDGLEGLEDLKLHPGKHF